MFEIMLNLTDALQIAGFFATLVVALSAIAGIFFLVSWIAATLKTISENRSKRRAWFKKIGIVKLLAAIAFIAIIFFLLKPAYDQVPNLRGDKLTLHS